MVKMLKIRDVGSKIKKLKDTPYIGENDQTIPSFEKKFNHPEPFKIEGFKLDLEKFSIDREIKTTPSFKKNFSRPEPYKIEDLGYTHSHRSNEHKNDFGFGPDIYKKPVRNSSNEIEYTDGVNVWKEKTWVDPMGITQKDIGAKPTYLRKWNMEKQREE